MKQTDGELAEKANAYGYPSFSNSEKHKAFNEGFIAGLQKGRELESEKAMRFAEWLSITGWSYLQEYEAWRQRKNLEYFTTYELYNSQEFVNYLKQFEK